MSTDFSKVLTQEEYDALSAREKKLYDQWADNKRAADLKMLKQTTEYHELNARLNKAKFETVNYEMLYVQSLEQRGSMIAKQQAAQAAIIQAQAESNASVVAGETNGVEPTPICTVLPYDEEASESILPTEDDLVDREGAEIGVATAEITED